MIDSQEVESAHVLVPLSVVEVEAVIAVAEQLVAGADHLRRVAMLLSLHADREVNGMLCDAVTLSPVISRLKRLIPEWRKAQYVAACDSPTSARTEESDGNDS